MTATIIVQVFIYVQLKALLEAPSITKPLSFPAHAPTLVIAQLAPVQPLGTATVDRLQFDLQRHADLVTDQLGDQEMLFLINRRTPSISKARVYED